MPRVVLDTVAVSQDPNHLEVVKRALLDALGLEQLAHAAKVLDPLPQLLFDGDNGPLDVARARDVVLGRVHHRRFEFGGHVARNRVVKHDALEFLAPQLEPHGGFVVGGPDFDDVAFGPEPSGQNFHVVAVVLQLNEAVNDAVAPDFLTQIEHQIERPVLLGVAQAVDGAHRGHHNGVGAGQQAAGGGVAQPLEFRVYGGVFVDEQVAPRHVGFGLVIVVIRHEELDGSAGKELAEFTG